MQRAIMDTVREAGSAITTQMVAEQFCAARGLHPDHATLLTVRNCACNIVGKMAARGVIREADKMGQHKGCFSRHRRHQI